MEGKPLTLSYFELYGKAEAIRMLLVYSKTPFTDNRFEIHGEAFQTFKASSKCANGQVPVQEVGDKCLNQSNAILRFLGKQQGYYGPDPFEEWFADAVLDTIEDVNNSMPRDSEGQPMYRLLFADTQLTEDNLNAFVTFRNKMQETIYLSKKLNG